MTNEYKYMCGTGNPRQPRGIFYALKIYIPTAIYCLSLCFHIAVPPSSKKMILGAPVMTAYQMADRNERRRERRANMTPAEREVDLYHKRRRRALREGRPAPEVPEALRVVPRAPNDIVVGRRFIRVRAPPVVLWADPGEPPRAPEPPRATPMVPVFIMNELKTMAEQLHLQWGCPICLCEKPPAEFIMSQCGHRVCSGCRNDMNSAGGYMSNIRCPECRS